MPTPFTIRCSERWRDVTDEAEGAAPAWTLARPDGVGAFQLSIATYRGGQIPNPTPQVLLSMLRDSAASRHLGEAADVVTEDGALRLAAGNFHHGDYFLRVWYVSDGQSFAKATYTCAWGEQRAELPDCEQMVRTLKFDAT
jgi:hypothetical protein